MAERVALARQQEEDRRVKEEVSNIAQDESVDEEDMVDAEGFQDEREIWEVTHVREEDLETTEGEGVDFLAELLELEG
jgi:hypothetical protein